MIITKCPLRISLVGGSTDIQPFLDKHEWGSVVSFPANVYTYITLKKRTSGYRINYNDLEIVNDPALIKNDVARVVVNYFDKGPVEISFNSDIPSHGSGLASSTSYIISLIYAYSILFDLKMSKFDCCKLAIELERGFNPLTGYQDSYGCGLGGFKRMIFRKNGQVEFMPLSSKILHDHTFYLIPTNLTRSSTKILESLNIDSLIHLRNTTEIFNKHTVSEYAFHQSVRYGWNLKKESSPEIMTDELQKLDDEYKNNNDIDSYKLLGAGGGGYFLLICKIPKPYLKMRGIEIEPDDIGVTLAHAS